MNNKSVNVLIENGRIIDPAQGLDVTSSLLISAGKIARVGGEDSSPHPEYDVIKADGLVVCPGFIDLHCHLRQPGFEEKETIATGTRAAAVGGFTTICCMPNTNPPLDTRATIYYVKSTAASEGVVHVLPIGCVSKERKGKELADLAELADAGVIAFSDDGAPVSDTNLMRQALEQSIDLDRPIINHCEDNTLSQGGMVNEGTISTELRLKGIPNAAEDNMVARDLALAAETGGRLHIAHVTTEGAIELIRQAKEKGIHVTAEVTPHHLTLTEDVVISYSANAKVNPPLRTSRDVAALIQGLNEGVIDIIATDHAPHTPAEKAHGFASAPFGISGFETALGSLMRLVHGGEITLTTLVAKFTSEPSRIIGAKYGKLGTLEVGSLADVTIFNPNKEWVVDTEKFASKGKNTPLANAVLKGKVIATIVGGKLVYRDDSLRMESKATQKVNYD